MNSFSLFDFYISLPLCDFLFLFPVLMKQSKVSPSGNPSVPVSQCSSNCLKVSVQRYLPVEMLTQPKAGKYNSFKKTNGHWGLNLVTPSGVRNQFKPK